MMDYSQLNQQKNELLNSDKPPRAREAAKRLGISEAEYVALSCGGTSVMLDKEAFVSILQALHRAGEVMALTRNEAVVLEHHGVYRNPVIKHSHVIFTDPDMDLRLKVTAWKYGFAVDENGRRSFQFFDAYGQAAHKIYMTDASDQTVYDAWVAEYRTEDGFEQMSVRTKPSSTPSAMPKVETEAIQKDWQALENAHHVNALLKAYGLTRPQAYRHLGDSAMALQKDALKSLLEQAAEESWPLLMFVPNGSATQIHNGTVHKLMDMGPWFNVLDPKFNMHANLELVTEAWLVYKQTDAKPVASLELFDADDKAVMMVYLHPEARSAQMTGRWESFLKSLKLEEVAV